MRCLEAVEKAVLVRGGCNLEANAVAERMGRARHSMMAVEWRLWCLLVPCPCSSLLSRCRRMWPVLWYPEEERLASSFLSPSSNQPRGRHSPCLYCLILSLRDTPFVYKSNR